MSWCPEAVVIYGYKLPRDKWNEGIEVYENHFLNFDISDYFIDTNPMSEDGDTFFGIITAGIGEDEPFAAITQFVISNEEVAELTNWFIKLYGYNYDKYHPDYYIGVRWV